LDPARKTFPGRSGEISGVTLERREQLLWRPVVQAADDSGLADFGP
jgi:hypothetical protein